MKFCLKLELRQKFNHDAQKIHDRLDTMSYYFSGVMHFEFLTESTTVKRGYKVINVSCNDYAEKFVKSDKRTYGSFIMTMRLLSVSKI